VKTKILTTDKDGRGKKGKKKIARQMTKKVRRTHKGYPMKTITKSQMTYKRKGRKR
jgi:hypothetical protein